MRSILLALAFAAVGLAAFTWRLSQRRAPSGPVDTAAVEPVGEVNEGGTASRPLAAPRDEAGVPKVQGAAADPQVPLEDRPVPAVDDATFAAQYKGWTMVRLEERLATLEQSYLAEVDRLCDQRFDAGQYRVVDASEVEGLDDSYDVLSSSDRQGVETRSRVVALELPTADASTDVDTRLEYQIVSLAPEQYPELYRQRAELCWVRAAVEARRGSDKDSR